MNKRDRGRQGERDGDRSIEMEISKKSSSAVSKCLGAQGGSGMEGEDELQLGGRVRPPLPWQGPVGSHPQLTLGTPSEWLPDNESSHPRGSGFLGMLCLDLQSAGGGVGGSL